MSSSNYQRGVEPWETSPKDGRQPRELRDSSPKPSGQRRRDRARKYQWILFAMIALTLGAGIAHLFLESVPFSQLNSFSAVLRLDYVRTNGLYYTILQVCSALSCVVAWMAIRAPIAYPIGLLALPVLLMLGWILLSLKKNLGYNLLMFVLVITELFTGLNAVIGIVGLLASMDPSHALAQEAFYIGLFLYPLLELIVLSKWKENIY